MNKLPEVLPDDKAQHAAILLVYLKTTRGRHVPEYAKAMAQGKGVPQGTFNRVGTELFGTLAQMRSTDRHKIIKDEPRIGQWFDNFIKENPTNAGVVVYQIACTESVNRPFDPQLYGR